MGLQKTTEPGAVHFTGGTQPCMRKHGLHAQPWMKAHRSAESRRKGILRSAANEVLEALAKTKGSVKTHTIQRVWGDDGNMDSLRLKWNNYEVCHIHKGGLMTRKDFHTQLGEIFGVSAEANTALNDALKHKVEQGGPGQLCSEEQFE